MLCVLALGAACGSDDPGTSVQLALRYDDALGLDTADVTIADRTESSAIAHRMLLLLPDDLVGSTTPIAVWARKAGKRTAYGTSSATPARGETVTAELTLTTCTPACSGDMLTTCTGPVVACVLGCSDDGDAHCVEPMPSNGVDPGAADLLAGTTRISAATTFDVDTGAITGGVTRPVGTGILGGIGYVQAPAFAATGAPLGIFVFHNVIVDADVKVTFTGSRAAVWLVGDSATIAGTLDVSAGGPTGETRPTPGPGGGAGGTAMVPAGGCGPGGPGTGDVEDTEDSAGAGGSAGAVGGAGGTAGGSPGGSPRAACLPPGLEPLQGGSGGGTGSPGGDSGTAAGGGGGGALQITALNKLEITGTIDAGGAGGEGGPAGVNSVGAGAGGGSGGAILLEAPTVIIARSAIVAANGGGGGGGGGFSAGSQPGLPGANAAALTTAALGGAGDMFGTDGGAGGARGSAAEAGGGSTDGNAGGGGGAVGAIVIRARVSTIEGTTTPQAFETDIRAGAPRSLPATDRAGFSVLGLGR